MYDITKITDADMSDPMLLFVDKVVWHLCAENQAWYDYYSQWEWDIINGRKTGKMMCFVNSDGGIGKGAIFTTFLFSHILGDDICYKSTGEAKEVLGDFTGPLEGKSFVVPLIVLFPSI
jgi:hypothetical protein